MPTSHRSCRRCCRGTGSLPLTEAAAGVVAALDAVARALVALVGAAVTRARQTAREAVEAASAALALTTHDLRAAAQTLAVVDVTQVVT